MSLVQASYIEIYNEEVRDLLGSDSKAKLPVKEDPKRGIFVQGLTSNTVTRCLYTYIGGVSIVRVYIMGPCMCVVKSNAHVCICAC